MQSNIKHVKNLYSFLASCHPSLTRSMVWCKICKRSQKVDSSYCLKHGWPKCHGKTMTIDDPSVWTIKT